MASEITIRNKTAHVKQLALAGGEIVTIPPTEEGSAGFKIRFDSDDEQKRVQQALNTPVVKRWIERNELEIGGASTREASSRESSSAPASHASGEGTGVRGTGSRSRGERE